MASKAEARSPEAAGRPARRRKTTVQAAPLMERPPLEVAERTAPADSLEPSGAAPAAQLVAADSGGAGPDLALRDIQRLHGMTLRFWQDHLDRAMATGQAIMVCRTPQEAVRLQIAYLQATVASGFVHAGEVARLSRQAARDMLPLRHG